MKQQTFWRRFTAVLLCAAMLCALAACGKQAEPATYTVTVQTVGGMPLEKVRVDVYRAEDPTDRVWAGMTDANGKVTFTTASSGALTATVSELTDGLKAQTSYPLDGETNVLAIDTALVVGDLADNTFALGDMMCDFTVAVSDTQLYTLSELLKTKKAVVLNFWFEGCGPCRAEFPYLQRAYEKYADELEVLAINPYDGTASSVAAYAEALKLTFPMIKTDETWVSAMKLTSFPTTVIIDRYGMIVFSHKSSITEEGVFEKIFAHFTSDEYVQGTVRNVTDLA